MLMAERAERRFGLGPKAGFAFPDNPRGYLLQQIENFDPCPAAIAAAPSGEKIAEATAANLEELRAQGVINFNSELMRGSDNSNNRNRPAINREVRKFLRTASRDFYAQAIAARIQTATESDNSFAERLVHFWSNHFAVSIDKPIIIGFAGLHEFEAIRPNIMGRFADLLKAASLSPAMLAYLDQTQSVGPESPAGTFVNARSSRRKAGLNENLAREILELHTLGARGGYDQNDVLQLAYALTGWTVSGLSHGRIAKRLNLDGNHGMPAFAEALHQPGTVQVMGRRYTQSGRNQSLAILEDLATHPSTARFIATKLARHFAADNPPEKLVARLEQNFLQTGGQLSSLYETLIMSPEVWQAEGKYTSPWEWMIAVNRLHGKSVYPPKRQAYLMRQMGQQIWRPGSPAGFGDRQSDWLGPDTLLKRIEISRLIANKAPSDIDALGLANRVFADSLSATTMTELNRAESTHQAYAMLLVSPEFLRR